MTLYHLRTYRTRHLVLLEECASWWAALPKVSLLDAAVEVGKPAFAGRAYISHIAKRIIAWSMSKCKLLTKYLIFLPNRRNVNGRGTRGKLWRYTSQLFPSLAPWLCRSVCHFPQCSRPHLVWIFHNGGTGRPGAICSISETDVYIPNVRTRARAEKAQRKCWPCRPKADNLDISIFLMGYDEGEEYSRAVSRIRSKQPKHTA